MNGSVAGHIWLLITIAIFAIMTLVAWVLKAKNKTLMGSSRPSTPYNEQFGVNNKKRNNTSAQWGSKLKSKLTLTKKGVKAANTAPPKSTTKTKSNHKPSRDILRLDKRLKKYFPSLNTKLQHNRIVAKDGTNKFMLTIDKRVSKGWRQLGDAKVINFHSLPSVYELQQLFDNYTNKTI